MTAIGNNLYALRKNASLTQAVVCEALNLSLPTLGRYENGKVSPTGETLVELAAYYQVQVGDLFIEGNFQTVEVPAKRTGALSKRERKLISAIRAGDYAMALRLMASEMRDATD